MRLLVTRPQPGASATQAMLAARGHGCVLAPCLEILPLAVKLPEHCAALIVTSGQAVPALPASLFDVPVFCVGDATAARLRQAGFHRVESAAGDARDLARLIISRRVAGVHVMAVGERHGLALARQLREAGITVVRRTVYRARPLRALAPDVTEALAGGGLDGVLFYSAETARAFARLAPAGTAPLTAFALSPAVAAAAQALPWTKIRVALAPTEADMMALLDD